MVRVMNAEIDRYVPALAAAGPPALALAYGGGFWLYIVHRGGWGTGDQGLATLIQHWIRDSTLMLPLVRIAVALVVRFANRLLERYDTRSSSILGIAVLATMIAMAASVAMVVTSSVLDVLVGTPLQRYDGPLVVNMAREGLVVLAANVVIAGVLVAVRFVSVSARHSGRRRRFVNPLPDVDRSSPGTSLATVKTRRTVLKLGAAGLATVVVGQSGVSQRSRVAVAGTIDLNVYINAGDVTMIDGTKVYMWGFGDTQDSLVVRCPDTPTCKLPARVIRAVQGDIINVSVTNRLDEPHSFTIPGVVDSGSILPGATKRLKFMAPKPGTYVYLDKLNAPINRLLGLHGVLMVEPTGDLNIPYIGGERWDFVRQFVWILQTVDPDWGELARQNLPIHKATSKPRYFMINDRSGKQSVHAEDTVPHGRVDEAALVRVVNMGAGVHSPHLHGNHVFVLTHNGKVLPIQMEKDTFMMRPLDRKDILIPYVSPQDAVHAITETQHYPVHCHTELSQTAGGGLYPSGMLTDWLIDP